MIYIKYCFLFVKLAKCRRHLVNDIKILLKRHKDEGVKTGRQVARILQGVASPRVCVYFSLLVVVKHWNYVLLLLLADLCSCFHHWYSKVSNIRLEPPQILGYAQVSWFWEANEIGQQRDRRDEHIQERGRHKKHNRKNNRKQIEKTKDSVTIVNSKENTMSTIHKCYLLHRHWIIYIRTSIALDTIVEIIYKYHMFFLFVCFVFFLS